MNFQGYGRLESDAGLHRTHWNLYQERTPEVKLRTKPDEASHVQVGDRGWRRLSDGGRFSIYSPPGTYTMELKVGDEIVASGDLEVLKDPGSAGSEAEIAEQMQVLTRLREMIVESVEMINASEWSRRQLYDLRTVWKELRAADEDEAETADGDAEPSEDGTEAGTEAPKDLLAAIEEVDAQLKELEGLYFDLRLTGPGQDSLRWKRLLSSQLVRLAWTMSGADVRPTDSQLEFFGELEEQVEATRALWAQIRDESIPALNALAVEQGVEAVILADPRD